MVLGATAPILLTSFEFGAPSLSCAITPQFCSYLKINYFKTTCLNTSLTYKVLLFHH